VPKEKTELAKSSEITNLIRDLIVHLHRSNVQLAESLVTDVAGRLKAIMQSGADPESSPVLRAQQTMFAIDEVRGLMSQRDFSAAVEAARDAEKEWRQKPAS